MDGGDTAADDAEAGAASYEYDENDENSVPEDDSSMPSKAEGVLVLNTTMDTAASADDEMGAPTDENNASASSLARRRYRYYAAIVPIFVLLLVGIILGVTLSNQSGDDTSKSSVPQEEVTGDASSSSSASPSASEPSGLRSTRMPSASPSRKEDSTASLSFAIPSVSPSEDDNSSTNLPTKYPSTGEVFVSAKFSVVNASTASEGTGQLTFNSSIINSTQTEQSSVASSTSPTQQNPSDSTQTEQSVVSSTSSTQQNSAPAFDASKWLEVFNSLALDGMTSTEATTVTAATSTTSTPAVQTSASTAITTPAPSKMPSSAPTSKPSRTPTEKPAIAFDVLPSATTSSPPKGEYWYPNWLANGTQTCKYDSDYPNEYMVEEYRLSFLFDSREECCAVYQSACLGDAATATATTTSSSSTEIPPIQVFTLETDAPTDTPSSPPSTKPTPTPTTPTPTNMPSSTPTSKPPSRAPTSKPVESASSNCFTISTYNSIDDDIERLKNNIASLRERSHFLGGIVRLAAHDFMDYDRRDQNNPMGPDGCFDASHDGNAGLPEDIWCSTCALTLLYEEKYPHISRADFWVASANAVIRQTSVGNALDLRSTFTWGRQDRDTCPGQGERLPTPAGCGQVEQVFLTRMGLDWRDAVALMGAHTLGRGDERFSQHHGTWMPSHADAMVFDKQYYEEIYLNAWRPRNRGTGFQDWTTGRDGIARVMLNTDLCLVYDIDGGSMCCSRTGMSYPNGQDQCINNEAARRSCPMISQSNSRWEARETVGELLGGGNPNSNNEPFYNAFTEAWRKATTVGQTNLLPLTDSCEQV